jgi:hypothetical protein
VCWKRLGHSSRSSTMFSTPATNSSHVMTAGWRHLFADTRARGKSPKLVMPTSRWPRDGLGQVRERRAAYGARPRVRSEVAHARFSCGADCRVLRR